MLLAVMFLLVGVPNAPLLPTTVAYSRPFSEQTDGIASVNISKFSSTSKAIITYTLPAETMLTAIALESTTNRVALTIPLNSKSHSHGTTTKWVSSSVDHKIRDTESGNRSTPISSVPSANTRSIPYATTRTSTSTTFTRTTTRSEPSTTAENDRSTTTRSGSSTTSESGSSTSTRSSTITTSKSSTIATRSGPSTTTASSGPATTTISGPPTTTRKTTESRGSMTESSEKTSLEVPRQRNVAKAGEIEILKEEVQSRSATELPPETTYHVVTKSKNDRTAKRITSIVDLQTIVTPETERVTKGPLALKPIGFRIGVSTSTPKIQAASSPSAKSIFQSPTIPTSTEKDRTSSLKTNLIMTSKPATTSLPFPVPSVSPPSQVQECYDMPQNLVGPIYHLPWINPKITSVSPESELKNVFHPTLPPAFPRRATKSLKSSRFRVAKNTTPSPVTLFPPLLKPDAQNLNYYKYGTTVSTLPAFDLLGNQSLLRTTSDPVKGTSASDQGISHTTPLYPVKTSIGNQLMLHRVFPSGGASLGNPKLQQVVPSRGGNKSVLHPEFPSKGASSGNSKVPLVMPLRPLKTKDGNHSGFLPSNPKVRPRVPSYSFTSTETSPPEILPELPAMDSVIVNVTQNCTNDYCVSDEDYIDMMLEYMFPTHYEWVLIGMHAIVFVGGLVGNALVCLAVYRNHSMRTVTNYFIVNLAVADFLVILLCLPPTVLWDVTETWFMGTALCKIVLYFQTVSVAVSVLTLTFISIDRWYAICCPLKFKSTTARAKTAIAVIWVLALACDIPELVVLQTKRKELSIDTMFFTQCEPSWSDKTDMVFHCLQTILLYTVPLIFMSIAYCQIVKVLWSSDNIPGHKERLNSSGSNVRSTSCRSDTIGRKKTVKRCISNTVSTSGQVICRRKAAKMLVAVVIMFAVCYFPVHLLSILRYTYDIPQTDATTACAMVSHWLCYANSAVNPVIYNFMSGKFRKEFANTFGCHRFSWRRPGIVRRRRRRPMVAPSVGCGPQPTEMAPLSRDGVANVVVDVENPC